MLATHARAIAVVRAAALVVRVLPSRHQRACAGASAERAALAQACASRVAAHVVLADPAEADRAVPRTRFAEHQFARAQAITGTRAQTLHAGIGRRAHEGARAVRTARVGGRAATTELVAGGRAADTIDAEAIGTRRAERARCTIR